VHVVAVLADGMRRRDVEHQAGASVQGEVGAGRTDIPLLLQPGTSGRRDSGAHVAVRCHQRRCLAVPAAADWRLAVARSVSGMLVACCTRLRGALQRRIPERQSTVTLTLPRAAGTSVVVAGGGQCYLSPKFWTVRKSFSRRKILLRNANLKTPILGKI